MSKSSFKSFEAIQKELPDLSKTISDLHLYYGHTPAKNSLATNSEPLKDHIDLVNQTAYQLIRLHRLEKVVDGLIEQICVQLNMKIGSDGNFIKELFFATIVFHDFGKLNENFQVVKMNNEHFFKKNLLIGTQHSILSAYLFLNYYLKKLKALQKENGIENSIAGIICAFADPILKHHSSTFDIGDIDRKECQELSRFLKSIKISSPVTFLPQIIDNKRDFEENIFAENEKSESHPLFPLLKLNFSLLTAADYLATLSYQHNTDLPDIEDENWWGVFSQDRKIDLYKKFERSENYNNLAFTDPKELMSKPLHLLKARSKKNLNSLRSRMLGEVILKLRENKDAHLFYLKAPTGAGKTNISLALAIEMLQHDVNINNILYVFPFTTLITQTYSTIKETLGINNDEMVQLHSKAEWNIKKGISNEDGRYSKKWVNHVDNLFVHYPIVLLSHIRFFDILKGNLKESNYLLHRIANSIVIIDEIQSYNPKFWDHVNYFITNYARAFNIKFIVMSATLPEIGRLTSNKHQEWVELVSNPADYFQNANFAQRVSFDFTLLEEKSSGENPLSALTDFIAEKSELYANQNKSEVKVIVEFITKKSATVFSMLVKNHPILRQYELLIMTGTILEPRRTEVKNWLKSDDWLKSHPKVILISTQVVEAGVDIDMDIGFKNSSLIDSDEQLAGRVNRNASKKNNVVYLFNLDSEGIVYQDDERLKIQREHLNLNEHKRILEEKDFDSFYNKIIEKHIANRNELIRYFPNYLEHLQKLHFTEAHKNFQLIKDNTESLFIPLSLPLAAFSKEEQHLLSKSDIRPNPENKISGIEIFNFYEQIILNQPENFIENRDGIRRIQSLLSKFSISVYPKTAEQIGMIERLDYNQQDPYKFGYLYCSGYEDYYSYEIGLNLPKEDRALDYI